MKKFVLVKKYSSDFLEPVWERIWQDPDRDLSFALDELSQVRTSSGFGIRSPFALLIGRNSVCSKTLGSGQTLADDMNKTHYLVSEDLVRSIGEQICYGLHRLHEGLGCPYAAVYPYNIGHDDRYHRNYFLWSAPTARLEAANTPWHELDPRWDLPYRAPEYATDGSPGIEADIYGLGRILYQLSPRMVKEEYESLLKSQVVDNPDQTAALANIILVTQRIDPKCRFRDAVALARALNPSTQLVELDISQARSLLQQGHRCFLEREYEKAEELWTAARAKDWLSVAVWNNLAVCKMRRQRWEEANDDLYPRTEFFA